MDHNTHIHHVYTCTTANRFIIRVSGGAREINREEGRKAGTIGVSLLDSPPGGRGCAGGKVSVSCLRACSKMVSRRNKHGLLLEPLLL